MGKEEEAAAGGEAPRNRIKKRRYLVEDVITKSSNKIEPLLVDFANGQPLEGAQLDGTLHRVKDKRGTHFKNSVLTVQTPMLSYAGTETNPVKEHSGVNMFLGMLNKENGRMRLIEVTQYTVQPIIDQEEPQTLDKDNEDANATFAQKQEAIAAAFGSRKAKQAVARRRQNKVETETMSNAIDQAAAAAPDFEAALTQHLEQQEEISLVEMLPPCNRQAARIEDVYKLEDLAPDDFLANLEEPATAILSKQQELDSSCTLLFRELVENAQHAGKFSNQLRLCCLALMVKYILAFLTCRDRQLRDFELGKTKDNTCRAVTSWIVKEYTQRQGNTIMTSNRDQDRALCLVLILSFISNKFELSVSTLLQSLPVKKEKLTSLMRVVGAVYKPAAHSFLLKLPLAKLSQGGKKRKRTKTK